MEKAMKANDTIIRLVNINKIYKTKESDVQALSNISLEVRRGEIFGILGQSGAGKSTLVRCINLLERPTEGQVFLENQDLMLLDKKELRRVRRTMGMIFQQFNLLMQRNALDNVCFPLEISGIPKKEAREKAIEFLDLVGIREKAKAYPAQLSGGQKQRVAIARALATNPDILLCDEATSALDPATTRSILNLLQELNRKLGITIVIITHELSVAQRICKRVAILNEGRTVECGETKSVFENPQSEITKALLNADEEI